MASDRTWTFKQLFGDKKTLILSGWSAPFGRPRKGAVVRDGIKIRQKTIRYPGSNLPPTRHIFGVHYEDFHLHGYFRDRELGNGGALDKKEEVKNFVLDQQQCDISWGSFVHVTGFIESFDPGLESESEIEWKMTILIDQDNFQLSQINNDQIDSLTIYSNILQEQSLGLENIQTNIGVFGVSSAFLDSIADAVSLVTGTVGQLVNISNSINDLESALVGDAQRLISGIHAAKTAIFNLLDTIESAQQDTFFIRDSAEDTLKWNSFQSATELLAIQSLSAMSSMEVLASESIRGRSSFTTRAKTGETWEQISIRIYGGPQEADAIRQINNVKFGKKPQNGQIVLLPGI